MNVNDARSEFYRRAANNFANSALLARYTATVHVEGETDVSFWTQIFHHFYPSGRFRFIYYSKSTTGSFASGSMHCLNYLPFLSEKFFVCIDSDNRYLLQESNINLKHLVFQTYAYSIENHYCFAPHLEYACYKVTNLPNTLFDFSKFLTEYSNIVYDLFVWHHYFLRNHIEELDVIPFNNLISFRGKISRWQIDNNGQFILSKISQRVNSKIRYLEKSYPDFDLETERKIYESLGVTRDTVYLFIRGHHLMDFLTKIGQNCCDALISDKKRSKRKKQQKKQITNKQLRSFKSVLNEKVWFDNYFCMNKLEEDIKTFEANNM